MFVKVTDEKRMIPAYDEPAAEEMPMFAENRVHQRSSGNPYPNKVVMQVDRQHRSEKPFRVITLENEFIRVELMPELGGRIYSAMDKRTGYDFLYKQHVIKPALIGLLGSWISGGCEFNWPCHHRPSSFMPVDVEIEKEESGAVTVWMSENEPLDRMKGMVGVRLAPGEARFDTRMKVYNRTAQRHSFLWWENAAVPVNEQYRLVFPPDVHYVQFHYRKNVTSYPVASGVYNGIRMGNEKDISYHRNTRQPTSYFCAETEYDFFGGYDEGKQCGIIHVADHTVSVGKKMFTWAYNQLSRSWEKALTDTDGAYAELMASSYSLNQPDFAWLMPYECKEFSQMWYPVGGIGMPLCACREAAFSVHDGKVLMQPTVAMRGFTLSVNGKTVNLDCDPKETVTVDAPEEVAELILKSASGRALLRYEKPADNELREMPDTIPDNPTLDTLKTAQELYLLGVHAEQYRDPAARPDRYWLEAVRRDPEYAPALTALANYELGHLRFEKAYAYAMRAWKKVTVRNFHPESGELQYLLGRITEALGREKEAVKWYMQAAWAQDARGRALTRAAMLAGRNGDAETMADLSAKALREHAGNETALLLHAMAMKRLSIDAAADLSAAESADPLNMVCKTLKYGVNEALFERMGADKCQSALDIASDLWEAGETALAVELLEKLPVKCAQTEYVRGFLTGDETAFAEAEKLGVGIAYPSREIEYRALKRAAECRPRDAKAKMLLGCILYGKENYREAEALWVKAKELEPGNYLHARNLAVARYSHLHRREEALTLLDEALALKPHDGQLIWEKAHVMTRLGKDPAKIAAFLEAENHPREDVIIELCRAYNRMGAWEKTVALMDKTDFTPCEGGEHAISEQYMFAHHALGRKLLKEGKTEEALAHFWAAQDIPDHLGAGLWNEVLLVPHQFYQAVCLKKLGRAQEAQALFDHILCLKQDYFSDANLPELPCWQAMVYREMGLYAPVQELIAAHLRRQEQALTAVDPGYNKTTPFFISYMDDARALREGGALWQKAMAAFAAGNEEKAAEYAKASLQKEPANLYAGLL